MAFSADAADEDESGEFVEEEISSCTSLEALLILQVTLQRHQPATADNLSEVTSGDKPGSRTLVPLYRTRAQYLVSKLSG